MCVISVEEEDRAIRLPLGAVGAAMPQEMYDIFHRPLFFQDCDRHSVIMQVKAHESYLFRCDIP